MLVAGEDPRFILRRLFILAGEDIGLANPHAIMMISACAHGFEWVGLPEGIYHLATATLYLATAPKSNSAGAIFAAMDDIKQGVSLTVPKHLRNSPHNREADDPDYLYPHSYPGHFVPQQYLPDGMEGRRWYAPSDQGYEAKVREWLEALRSSGQVGRHPGD